MSKTIRVRTTPNGDDNFVKINLEQDFDFVEILSLRISQKELYTKFCSDYGAIVGRVIVNNGFGVPNAKVSVFIPVSDIDKDKPEISGFYPYETISDTDADGVRYNLLPSSNDTNNDCFTPVGTFPDKRQFLDNDDLLGIYCEYYKFTTTTNDAGDYMIFGVPAGAHIMYVEADMSDIGNISQKPYDYIRRGSTVENFDSTAKFRREENMDSMNNIINRSPVGVNVQPFWGDEDNCNVMITRRDIDLQVNVTPHAIFIGSIFGDNEENSLNLHCRARKAMGVLDGQTAGSGKIEMIRETIDGVIERYDVRGGQVIDKDGTWAYQIPMNLDYRITDEYGDLIPSDDPKKGLPTKSNVRFRVGMDVTGGEGRLRTRGKFLIPHNPHQLGLGTPDLEFPHGTPGVDFNFGQTTHKSSLTTLEWNTIYSVKQYIARYEKTKEPSDNRIRTYMGIKDVDSARGKYTPHPFNRLNVESSSLFEFICGLVLALAGILILINLLIITPINGIIYLLNQALGWAGVDIGYIACVTLECGGRDYAPGCLACSSSENLTDLCFGCAEAGGGLGSNTSCVGSDNGDIANDWFDTNPWGDAGYTNCVALSLLESENLLKFDFYNDWVNGTLYSPLFKYRNKSENGGEEKFCEWSCGGGGVNNNNDPNSSYDNDCYDDMYIIDTCTESCDVGDNRGITDTSSRHIPEGIIEKRDDTLYYTPRSKNTNRKVLATDMIVMGSSVKCHWKGLPYVFDVFPSTTYNMPPLRAETMTDPTDPTEQIAFITGIDSPSTDVNDSLFINVDCITYDESLGQQCGNIRRQCELGVGLDQYRVLNGVTTSADTKIDNYDIDYEFGRNVFAWMNNYTLNTTVLLSDVDCRWGITPNYPSCGNQVGTVYYNRFRYNDIGITQTDKPPIAPDASFFFYFGLNRNATALQRMKEQYFAPCPITEDADFVVIGNVTNNSNVNITPGNGEIDITIIGGTGPYTYTWTYPDGTVHVIMSPNSPDIDGLVGGTYTLTVVDGGGLSVITTFLVQDPTPVTCFVSATNASFGIADADINIFVTGGQAPYTAVVFDTTWLTPTSYSFTGPTEVLSPFDVGEYNVTISDVNGLSCNTIITITEPEPLTMFVNSVWSEDVPPNILTAGGAPTCPLTSNGFLNIIPTGGTGPYSVLVTSNDMLLPDGTTTTYTSTDFNVTGIGSGTFTVTVTDNGGQSVTETYLLIEPIAPLLSQFNITVVNDTGIGDGSITIYPTGTYNNITYYLNGQPMISTAPLYTYDNLVAGTYTVHFAGDGCESNIISVYV